MLVAKSVVVTPGCKPGAARNNPVLDGVQLESDELSALLSRSSRIYDVLCGAKDLTNLTAVFGFLIAVSVAAAWQPSRRAVRVDPAQVLRHE